MLVGRPATLAAEAPGQLFQHAHSPHRPAHIVKQRPVRDRHPAVVAGVLAADGKIAEILGAPAQKLPGKGAEAGDGIGMDPAALDQVVGKRRFALPQFPVFPVPGVGAESSGAQVHLPHALGRLVQGRPELPDLLLLPPLRILEAGNVHRRDQHHRIGVVVLHPDAPDMPPVPAAPAIGGDAVDMLRRRLFLQRISQRLFQRGQIVRVDQFRKGLRQGKGAHVDPEDPAVAGADIDHLGRAPHFQQRYAAVHFFQQIAQGDRVHRAEDLLRLVLIAAAVLHAETVFAGFFRLVKGQVRRLVQPLEALPLGG